MARADFAAKLARRRARAGLSLADLAAEAHSHRGYLSNVEHGHRWPSRSVALVLDTALHADGELAALWETGQAAGAPHAVPDDFDRFERALAAPQRTDHAVVDHLARVLAEQRRAEDALGARRLRPVTLAQIRIIETLTDDAPEPIRHDLLSVLSHYQQFAGWLGQDSMDAAGARRHYDRAMSAAQEIGDPDMATSVLSLLSHLAWSRGNATTAVELAHAGRSNPRKVSDAVLALAAQQEARGHALAGDAVATERALDQSASLTVAAAEHPDQAPPWVYFNDPTRLGFQPANLAVTTGSALAAQELRRVRAALHKLGATRELTELTEHLRALTADG
ncbi:MAG: helix-turn-helix domain-containing protein [Pseudonocardiaceae bacterium]